MDISVKNYVKAIAIGFTLVGVVILVVEGVSATLDTAMTILATLFFLTGSIFAIDYTLFIDEEKISFRLRFTVSKSTITPLEDIKSVYRVDALSGGLVFPKHTVHITHSSGYYPIATMNENFYACIDLLVKHLPSEKIDDSIRQINRRSGRP